MAERDILDVDQDLVLALLVPDLPPCVAGVGEHHPDGALGPGHCRAVPVAGPVVGGGTEDSVGGQGLGDREQAPAGQVLAEDPFDHWRGDRVGFEAMQASTVHSLRRVGVGPGVGEPVAVGWPATEESALGGGLGGHRGANPDLDAVAFAFAHSAVERHDQVVGVTARVNRAADLGHPQPDVVGLE